ncbi:hypothetical protein [Heyndrickxia ginsengihumi]|uniref:hypothetical protein n=1 Tax=Heyndrickxia ginsengihumi TaxID=363870 RepID=UPI003D1E841F
MKTIYQKYLSQLSWWKQLSINVGAVLTALLATLTASHVHINWFTSDTVNAISQDIITIGTFFVGSFVGLFNTYMTERSKKKAKAIAEQYAKEKAVSDAAKVAKAQAVLAVTNNSETIPSTEGQTTTTQSN